MKSKKIIVLTIFLICFFINTYSLMVLDEDDFKKDVEIAVKKILRLSDTHEVRFCFPEISTYNIVSGYIPFIKMSTGSFRLNDLWTDKVYFEFYNVKLDTEILHNEKRLVADPRMKIRLYAEISEKAINNLLYKKRKKIKVKDPEALLRDGFIILKGHVKAMFVSSYIRAKGYFYIENGKQINFASNYIALNKIKLPKFLLVRIINTINPVLDMNELDFDIKLRDIILKDRKVVITSFPDGFSGEEL